MKYELGQVTYDGYGHEHKVGDFRKISYGKKNIGTANAGLKIIYGMKIIIKNLTSMTHSRTGLKIIP